MSRLSFTPGGVFDGRLIGELLRRDKPAGLPAGTRVGAFKVLRELGRGGLGVVYLAERADGAFDQKVALKLIQPGHEHDLADAQFARERRILARLEHPSIARLIDGGRAHGLIWFAMEYVQGERIDHYCKHHRLDGAARLRLLLKVCDAVAHAHAHLIVHRDIKPLNILVNEDGQPRLLDFGIATVLDETDITTEPHAATPGFASPEQCRGEASGVATDIFQLGRLLEILMHGVRWNDREGLDAVCRRAVNERAEQRYASVDAFAADIQALLASRPVSAGHPRWRYRSRLFLHRHRLASLATTAVLFAFLGTVGYFLWHLDAARQQAEQEAITAQQISEFMITVFEGADPYVHRGRIPTVFDLLESGRERLDVELADEPRVKAALQAALGRIHWAMDEREKARQLLALAVAHGETDERLPAVELAERKQWLARTLSPEQERVESRHQLSGALALLVGHPDDVELQGSLLRDLDITDCFEGNVEPAIERLSAAIAAARGTPSENTQSFATDLFYLGLYLNDTGRIDEAARLMGEAHARTRQLLGEDHPSTADFGSVLAVVLARMGEADAAEAMIDEAIEQILKVFGSHSASMAMMLGRQGDVALHRGDHEAAIKHYRQAIALGDSLPPETNNIYSVNTLQGLGDALMALERWDEAKTAYQQMLARGEQGGHVSGPDTGHRPLRLARVYAALGECEQALDYHARARERATHVSRLYDIHAALAKPLTGCE